MFCTACTINESLFINCVKLRIAFLFLQTGSGKTYTMGTGFDMSSNEGEKGIIPRAVHQLFEGINMQRNEAINKNMTPPDFKIVAQFMEVLFFCYFN